jgi:hypothetical protein
MADPRANGVRFITLPTLAQPRSGERGISQPAPT